MFGFPMTHAPRYGSYDLLLKQESTGWECQIISQGKLIAQTMRFLGRDAALTEAKKIIDGYSKGWRAR
jgi:hypothetical protein